MRIIDPHMVSSFFYNCKMVYMHATTQLENRSAWVAECSLNMQVTTGVAGNICLVEHLQSQHLSIPTGLQYSPIGLPIMEYLKTRLDRLGVNV